MESHKPPFQIIVPGKTFRYEASDASHEVNFQQLEGLMVGENISISNFRFIVDEFLKQFLDDGSIEVRFRPSYFPFVEPGVEVDVKLNGEWLEVMGAGMVHPAVFTYAGLDPKKYQGFAFGMGVDRLAMIKYNIPDIRLLYSGDLRFSRQFKL
jgi:phenylalanyl-tRNA synthetase alpha chain